MRKKLSPAAPSRHSSKNSNSENQTLLSAKRFDIYNKASKAKANEKLNSKTFTMRGVGLPKPAFEYYYDEYDEYLSS